jgi:hypothetical protein
MAAAKAAGATSMAAEATVTVSRPGAGGVIMLMQIGSKQEIQTATGRTCLNWVGSGPTQAGSGLGQCYPTESGLRRTSLSSWRARLRY